MFKAAGKRVNPCEMAELREALNGRVLGGPAFSIPAGTRSVATELIYLANLSPQTKRLLGGTGTTLAGSVLPPAVRDVVVTAKVNGASVYDIGRTHKDGDPIYTGGSVGKRYPVWEITSHTLAFAYTEITPAALARDMTDPTEHLRIDRLEAVEDGEEQFLVVRYKSVAGGTGSIGSTYTPWEGSTGQTASGGVAYRPELAFHPVSASRDKLRSLGYPPDLELAKVWRARSRQGYRWASNCVVLSDGSVHCLPAIRRHPQTGNKVLLTTPTLARGHFLLWNGHVRVDRGRVTYIGTSGRIADRAGRAKEIFLNPVPLLKAWGFELAPDLKLVSEHATTKHLVDEERAIIYGPQK